MSGQGSDYELHTSGAFHVRNFSQKKPFANFLPGIAGPYGIPMWVFYVNRGQAIASFGTKNKDNAILEFFPANKAYQEVSRVGFRTFIKLHTSGRVLFYEPFCGRLNGQAAQVMEISPYELVIQETNKNLGLEVKVRYFTVPGEPLAVLAREVTIKNTLKHKIELELLDGLPSVNPYGMSEYLVKNMSRTIESWMVVDNLHTHKAPFFHLKVDASDRPEVLPIHEGNFYFTLAFENHKKGQLTDPIIDPNVIFGALLDFSYPTHFFKPGFFKIPHGMRDKNITPCAFSHAVTEMNSGEAKSFVSYFGQAGSVEILNRYVSETKDPGYFDKKRSENKDLIESIQSKLFTVTSSTAYDLYCGQTYLDNVLRGGAPFNFGKTNDAPLSQYIYSRKHGDLERDYNRFLVEPTYFSQGDGNFRDVNQNRRNSVWFNPSIKDEDVKTFLNLMQLDGFNPLVIKGVQFSFKRSEQSKKVLKDFPKSTQISLVEDFFKNSFSLGSLYGFLEEKHIISRNHFKKFLEKIGPFLTKEQQAEHGEGFWIDHWTYNLDIIESYFAIYPEESRRVLFERREYTFYDTAFRVRPRSLKYFLKAPADVRQYKAVFCDPLKKKIIEARSKEATFVRMRQGLGEVYKTTLFVKLLCIFSNKFASLDPGGIGIEMEADKPGWLDALNGLPGLLGSSLCETFELKRLALFMIEHIEADKAGLNRSQGLPVELYEFMKVLEKTTVKYFSSIKSSAGGKRDILFWEAIHTAKEKFREKTFMGLSGKEKKAELAEIKLFLEHAREKIQIALEGMNKRGALLLPTYFENRVSRFKLSKENEITPLAFEQKALYPFLEGFVHALKVEKDLNCRKEILKTVRASDLYDRKLGMYKLNVPSKGASLEIGRASVFTPGWLENESIWLHMEYKFMLEILKGGMTGEFFKDFEKVLVPFQPPERYGRSILENSSFIVSSAFFDETYHGAGFVARLSGSTAEFLNMWLIMNVGKRPFVLSADRKLSLLFEPSLPAWLFTSKTVIRTFYDHRREPIEVTVPRNCLVFLFLGKTLVFYHNPKRLDTFGNQKVSVKKIALKSASGEVLEFKGDTVPSPYAAEVRDGFFPRMDIELG